MKKAYFLTLCIFGCVASQDQSIAEKLGESSSSGLSQEVSETLPDSSGSLASLGVSESLENKENTPDSFYMVPATCTITLCKTDDAIMYCKYSQKGGYKQWLQDLKKNIEDYDKFKEILIHPLIHNCYWNDNWGGKNHRNIEWLLQLKKKEGDVDLQMVREIIKFGTQMRHKKHSVRLNKKSEKQSDTN